MPDDRVERVKAFLRDYAALVRRHGAAWTYDGGWGTPDQVHLLEVSRPEVEAWIAAMESGTTPTPLQGSDLD